MRQKGLQSQEPKGIENKDIATGQDYQAVLSEAIALYGYKFGVIYRIYCEKTSFSYIGQTKDVYNGNTGKTKGLSRIKIHYNALKKGCHPHLKLQAAWDSSKGKSIRHEILEVIPCAEDEGEWIFRKKLLSAEKPWQEVYKHHEELAPVRHYALKAQELKELKGAGIVNNATFVYFALKLKNPWCDRPIRIKPAEFAVEWGIPESSVYEAIAKLDQAGLLPDWFEREIYENPEHQVVQRLRDELGGQVEVVTAVGRIDLLTETEVIEVKQVSDWKSALGQILTYSAFFPEHTKRIHLFGDCTPKKKQVICSTLLSFGVIATFEGVEV